MAPRSKPKVPALGGYAAKDCPTKIHKDHDASYQGLQDEVDAFSQSLMDGGNVFEDEVGDALAEAVPSFAVIDCTGKPRLSRLEEPLRQARKASVVTVLGDRSKESLAARENVVHELLANPGRIQTIWNPRLRKWRRLEGGTYEWGTRASEPDFLKRNRQVQRNGAKVWTWLGGDVKHHNPFEGKSAATNWEYSTLDQLAKGGRKVVKGGMDHMGRIKLKNTMQLAHYQRALEFHGFADSEPVGCIVGKPFDGELRAIWTSLDIPAYNRNKESALEIYDAKFDRALDIAATAIDRAEDPDLDMLHPPVWRGDCKTCVWQSSCRDELVEVDHISLLQGVTPTRIDVHLEAGVSRISELARLDIPTAEVLEAGIEDLGEVVEEAKQGVLPADEPVATLLSNRRDRIKVEDALFAAGVETVGDAAKLDPVTAGYEKAPSGGFVSVIEQARVIEYSRSRTNTHVFRARGVDSLEIPQRPVTVHFDMENEKHVYLWGCRVDFQKAGKKGNYDLSNTRSTYRSFVDWSATDEGEARAFAEFWSYLQEMEALATELHGPDSIQFMHYTGAEDRCFEALAKKHVGVAGVPTIAEVEKFIARDAKVDLYPLLTKQLVWPTEDLSLKSLAKHAKFMWRDEDPSGANSVTWYQEAINHPDPDVRSDQRQRILEYNADDCAAQAVLLEWVSRFNVVRNKSNQLRSVTALDDRYSPRRRRPRPRRKAA